MIVGAWRIADEHILQHLLDALRRPGIANEIGAELAFAHLAERHVIAHDLKLLTVLFDRGENIMRIRLLH